MSARLSTLSSLANAGRQIGGSRLVSRGAAREIRTWIFLFVSVSVDFVNANLGKIIPKCFDSGAALNQYRSDMLTLLWDFDGCLVDSREAIVRSFAAAFNSLNQDSPSQHDLVSSIGRPLDLVFQEFLPGANNSAIERAVCEFRAAHALVGYEAYKPYAGIPELLEKLAQDGALQAIVTAKPYGLVKRAVEGAGLSNIFEGEYGHMMFGGSYVERSTNKANIIRTALAQLTLNNGRPSREAGEIYMIGDRASDMRAARSCKINGIGVLWGYGTRRELNDAEATMIFDEPEELSDFLLKLPKQSELFDVSTLSNSVRAA